MKQLRFLELLWLVVCLFCIGFGASLVWESEHGLPAVYATLRSRGVAATATLVLCAPGLGGGRGVGCRLSIDDQGYSRTWVYPEDTAQFEGLEPGAPVPVLVDPRHPRTIYTVRDVERRTNTGIGSPVLWLGVVLVLGGTAGLAAFRRLVRARRRVAVGA